MSNCPNPVISRIYTLLIHWTQKKNKRESRFGHVFESQMQMQTYVFRYILFFQAFVRKYEWHVFACFVLPRPISTLSSAKYSNISVFVFHYHSVSVNRTMFSVQVIRRLQSVACCRVVPGIPARLSSLRSPCPVVTQPRSTNAVVGDAVGALAGTNTPVSHSSRALTTITTTTKTTTDSQPDYMHASNSSTATNNSNSKLFGTHRVAGPIVHARSFHSPVHSVWPGSTGIARSSASKEDVDCAESKPKTRRPTLFDLIAMLPRPGLVPTPKPVGWAQSVNKFGIGLQFRRKDWNPDYPEPCFWTITRFKPSLHGRRPRVWGILTWRGVAEEHERTITKTNKRGGWELMPKDYEKFRPYLATRITNWNVRETLCVPAKAEPVARPHLAELGLPPAVPELEEIDTESTEYETMTESGEEEEYTILGASTGPESSSDADTKP
jgi:Mitochondrial 28S ribosomal protein S34